jgi:transposase-like protein
MSLREACAECRAQQCKKHGPIHTGKQNHQCKVCGRQCVVDTTRRVIDEEHHILVQYLFRKEHTAWIH